MVHIGSESIGRESALGGGGHMPIVYQSLLMTENWSEFDQIFFFFRIWGKNLFFFQDLFGTLVQFQTKFVISDLIGTYSVTVEPWFPEYVCR